MTNKSTRNTADLPLSMNQPLNAKTSDNARKNNARGQDTPCVTSNVETGGALSTGLDKLAVLRHCLQQNQQKQLLGAAFPKPVQG